ncbi:MAG: DUF4870 domain-containing protein [Planctomycetes bacterium]|nr:DUF4870 domain-containing protein [Planctomycetota bacterium]
MQPSDQVPPADQGAPGAAPDNYGPPSKESCTMAMLAHLLGAITGFLGPLIIWLIKKDTDPFVNDQGKEALNFQLTLLIGYFVCVVLMFVTCFVLFFMPFIPMVVGLVFGIMAALEANKGVTYRYPFAIRMIK